MAVYLICYAGAYLFSQSGHDIPAGLGLIGAALYLYWSDYRKSRNVLDLRGVFCLSFVGGQGVACFKLSKLATDWSGMTWLSFLAAVLGFWLVFEFLGSRNSPGRGRRTRWRDVRDTKQSLFLCAMGITLVSLGCFAAEAAVLGYIPFFMRVAHAYSYFHLTGIHYFTVSCVLVPAISVIYFCSGKRKTGVETAAMVLLDVIALAIPILCVSRFQFIMAVFLALLTYVLLDSRLHIGYVLAALAVLVPVYLVLTVARSHDSNYLNQIFEMKNSDLPLAITQPYMYVANNYDNFNCLVEGIEEHTLGLRMLVPFTTLSGAKFFIPGITDFIPYITKEELNTLTLFYDAYYDFGIAGVFGFSCVLGTLASYLTRMLWNLRNPIGYLFYAQIAMYFSFSFFTTWFGNPTTWFYLAVTGAAAFAVAERWGCRR